MLFDALYATYIVTFKSFYIPGITPVATAVRVHCPYVAVGSAFNRRQIDSGRKRDVPCLPIALNGMYAFPYALRPGTEILPACHVAEIVHIGHAPIAMTVTRIFVHRGSSPAIAPYIENPFISRRSSHPVTIDPVNRISGNDGRRRCLGCRKRGESKQRKGSRQAGCQKIPFHTFIELHNRRPRSPAPTPSC